MPKKRLAVLSLGGTIASVKGSGAGVSPELGAAELAQAVPELAGLCELKAETVAKVGSPSLPIALLYGLAARIESAAKAGEIDAAIVTQGTDTIEETSFLLDCLLDVDIPVIVIGAMRNPTMASPDGPGNLLNAARVALDPAVGSQARALGVLVVMLDSIHAAHEVVKSNSHRIDAFASPHSGPIGTIIEDRVRLSMLPQRQHRRSLLTQIGEGSAGRLAERDLAVAYLPLTLGDSGALLHAIRQSENRLGFAGMVLGLMGGGHAPSWLVDDISSLSRMMPVVGCGRMGSGALLEKTYDFPGAEMDLRRNGVIWGGRLHPFKARLLLDLLLRAQASHDGIAAVFDAFN